MSDTLHETHVCRDCGAEITLPYARVDRNLEGYWERAYWRVVPTLAAALPKARDALTPDEETASKCLVCDEVIVYRRGDPVVHVGCSIADHTEEAVRLYGERHPAVKEAAETLRAALLAANPYAYTPGTATPPVEQASASLREMAERSLDRRFAPPGHATYREPRLTADEWRSAYFVLADIALRQLDECRAVGENDDAVLPG